MANEDTKQPKTDLHALRTFKSDLSETLKGGKTSITDVYLKQEKNPQRDKETPPALVKKIALFSFIGLAIAALALLIFLVTRSDGGKETGDITKAPRSILTNEQEIPLEVADKADFEKKFSSLFEKTYDAGNLVYLPVKIIGGNFLTSKDFLDLLESRAPALTTSFITQNFQLGLLNLQRLHPVLILEIRRGQYDNAFAGMLRWEKQLPKDLGFILSNMESPPRLILFEDKLIKNQNVRVLKEETETIMLYSVFNKKYIIITDSETAFKEIIRRIQRYL